MKAKANAPVSSSSLTVLWTAALIALSATTPTPGTADQHAATASDTRVADISLADLDLSTPAGLRAARDRLRTMARRLCSEPTDRREHSHQPNFVACVDNTVAGALRQINRSVLKSVTRARDVSLADLDLATPEGLRAARERLRTMARRLCAELAHSRELSYQPNFAACVDDTLAGALAQVNALAAAKELRTAQRTAP